MKLDFDIVREVLIEIESKTSLDEYVIYNKTDTEINKFYALLKLEESNLINCHIIEAWGGPIGIRVFSLTWNGHEFLNNIRSSKVVQHTKTVIKDLGSVSLKVFSQIAESYIKSQIGL